MPKFNEARQNVRETKNYEGGVAYTLSNELELYTATVTTFLEDKYYETADERLARIQKLIEHQVVGGGTFDDAKFVGQLAVYAREKMHLRSIPLVLAVELAKHHSGDNLVSKVVERVVGRVDEITELLAYYAQTNNRTGTKQLGKLSKQIQKGLASCFNRFDEYQFSKYNRQGRTVSLRDALFLVHPKAKDEVQQGIFDRLAKDELKTAETWEVKRSEAGQEGSERSGKEVWEELIDAKKMGYFATLRNLRNFINDGVSDEHLVKVANYLKNPVAVKNSKLFPYRFFSAYLELQDISNFKVGPILDALNEAMGLTAENIPGFDESSKILIACDMSGSMYSPMSEKSKINIRQVGLALGSVLRQRCNHCMVGLFASDYKQFTLPKGNVLGTVNQLSHVNVGGATNGHLAVDSLIKTNTSVDKVYVFTDCQLWDSSSSWYISGSNSLKESWNKYKNTAAGKDAKIYIFDLTGYGTTPLDIVQKDVYLVSGFSEHIFGVLANLERGEDALKEIRAVGL